MLVRLSHSHVRIGTFQRLSYLRDTASMKRLLDYSLATYFGTDGGNAPAETLLRLTAERTATTAADWIAAGFVHGVLNSDNINITGESFDYGPWRFAPTYDPAFTAAYFDTTGLYAFSRQPEAVAWNLTRLAEVPAAAGRARGHRSGAQQLLAGVPAGDVGRCAPATRPRVARRGEGLASWWSPSLRSSAKCRSPMSAFGSTGVAAG